MDGGRAERDGGPPPDGVRGDGATRHLGYFCDDVPTTSKRLEESGFALEACAVVDGNPSILACHLAPCGVRIEIVDRARMPDFPAYLRSKTPQ